MKRRRIVSGEYNRHGYTVLLGTASGTSAMYSAGNNPQDSQQHMAAGMKLRQLRAFCVKTCREIATERQADYGGVIRIPEEAS